MVLLIENVYTILTIDNGKIIRIRTIAVEYNKIIDDFGEINY